MAYFLYWKKIFLYSESPVALGDETVNDLINERQAQDALEALVAQEQLAAETLQATPEQPVEPVGTTTGRAERKKFDSNFKCKKCFKVCIV